MRGREGGRGREGRWRERGSKAEREGGIHTYIHTCTCSSCHHNRDSQSKGRREGGREGGRGREGKEKEEEQKGEKGGQRREGE